MSRRGTAKDNLARAAESKTGTFGEMMSRATEKPEASARASASWATPRPTEKVRQPRSRNAASNVATLIPVPTAGEELERLYDHVTVESLYDVIDLILPKLHQNDQNIYLQLFRRTHAIGRTKCVIKVEDLGALAKVGNNGVYYSLKRLEKMTPPLAKKIGARLGKGKDQGIEIEVYFPRTL